VADAAADCLHYLWRGHHISVPMHFSAPGLAGQNALLATAHIVDVLDLLRTHMTSDWQPS
jgi:hypothetical protein